MKKNDIIEKLQELGIKSGNAYPKSSFPYGGYNGEIVVGLYEREMKDDFYFYNNYDKKLYVWRKDGIEYDVDNASEKFMVPLSRCEVIWEDKPYVELPDKPYREMTMREYACIQMLIPESGLDWLDALIQKAKAGKVITPDYKQFL